MRFLRSRALRRRYAPTLFFLTVLVGPSLVQAQGAYLPGEAKGLGFAAALSGNKLGLGPSLTVGYAAKRQFGLRVTLANLYYEERSSVHTRLFAPEISLLDTKQVAGRAIDAEATLAYQHSRLIYRDSNESADHLNSFSVGLALSRDLIASPAYAVVPQVGVLYTAVYFGENAPNDPLITAGFGLGIGLPLGGGKMLTLEPGAAYNKGGVTASVGLGFIVTE